MERITHQMLHRGVSRTMKKGCIACHTKAVGCADEGGLDPVREHGGKFHAECEFWEKVVWEVAWITAAMTIVLKLLQNVGCLLQVSFLLPTLLLPFIP